MIRLASPRSSRFSSVQSLRHVWFFVPPWTVASQASLSITNSCSLLKLISFESVMPSHHCTLCCPLLPASIFPNIRVFSEKSVLGIRGQSNGVSASAIVLPVNIHDWFPLGLTACISLQSKGQSSPTSQFKSINSSALSFLYRQTLTSILDYWKIHSFD